MPWPARCCASRSTAPSPSWGEAPITATEPQTGIRRRATAWLLAGGLALGLGAAALAQGAGARLDRLNQREDALTAEQGANLNRLSRLLTVLALYRRDPPPALLVSPEDAVKAARAAILVKAITPELQRRAQAYAVEAREIARQRRMALLASEDLLTEDSLRAEMKPPPEGDFVDPRNSDDVGPVTLPQALVSPADGPLVHGFGDTLVGGGRSNGVTIRAASRAQVAAPGDGVVQYAGPVKGWGVILILRLAGGCHLVLAGLDRTSVGVGQSVAAGDAVGWMPDGRHAPSDLYLEIRERGDPVNPGRWLKARTG